MLLLMPCRLFATLKPGGRLLFTDYCRSDAEPSAEFAAYVEQRGYDLHPLAAYRAMIEAAGFQDVTAEDRTWQFEECLRRELAAAQKGRASFVAEFSERDFEEVVANWQAKLERVEAGEQRWGLFRAVKPL